jgi:hypothetical protein
MSDRKNRFTIDGGEKERDEEKFRGNEEVRKRRGES